jgi:hypothetical protein
MSSKAHMLAFWVVGDVTRLKYFYSGTLDGAIKTNIEHRHPKELAGISDEEISQARVLIKKAMKNLGWEVNEERENLENQRGGSDTHRQTHG